MENAREEKAPIGAKKDPNGLSAYLRVSFGAEKNGPKNLAKLAKCAVSTAKKYIYGKRIPGGKVVCELLTHPRFRDGLASFQDSLRTSDHQELVARVASLRTQLERIEQSLRQKDVEDATAPCIQTIGLDVHTRGVRTPRHGRVVGPEGMIPEQPLERQKRLSCEKKN